ncbi:flavoprotein [Amycolatopsis thailandensis]|uniref:Flavoprotein n=1 Tax=Amycolatopsis thailandensis TaxID=589330 RepID=A0A229SCM7_9PSEU|nr:flavoprotein [Amycolatopsis thailandensis]OXM56662.1 flavoprotein [Amycolatopsis thailandensis]
MRRVLGLVASSCGGLDTRFAAQLAKPAADRGWELAITLTPTAARWLEKTGGIGDLEACTGLPVRSTSRLPGEPRPHPDPAVFLFAPASANSVAKLALGIADNQALTLLGDVLGTPGITIVLGYQIQDTRVHHPAWQRHLDTLASAGVTTARLTPDASWTSVLDLLPAA